MALHPVAMRHGMRDGRWTCHDQLFQFQELIHLTRRERKKQIFDASKIPRTHWRQAYDLRLDCQRVRNNLLEDRKLVPKALQHRHALLLAYQNLQPRSVVEHIDNKNFDKIKELDRLRYKKQQRMKVLTDLTYELDNRRESIKSDMFSRSQRRSQQNILNLIQAMTVRQELAEQSKQTFQSILQLLKRDSTYFEAVINILKSDRRTQFRCVIRATELGQLATEALANLRNEIKYLKQELKLSMKERDTSIKEVTMKVKNLVMKCKILIRKDVDEQLDETSVLSESDVSLSLQLSTAETIMKLMQDLTCASNFDDIFPKMEEQLRLRNRLLNKIQIGVAMRDDLLNMRNHAELMLATLEHAMVDTTFKYKEDKNKLLKEYEKARSHRERAQSEYQEHGKLLCTIRASLQTLFEMLTRMRGPNEVEEKSRSVLFDILADGEKYDIPPPYDKNCVRLFRTVGCQLLILMKHASEIKETIDTKEAEELYFYQIIDSLSESKIDETDYSSLLLQEIESEDLSVLTRVEAKLRSQEIVKYFKMANLLSTGQRPLKV